MAWVELNSTPIMLECKLVLLQVAIRKSKNVLEVRVVWMTPLRALEESNSIDPVLLICCALSGSVVLVACSKVWIDFIRIGGRDGPDKAHRGR
jgi:hypothetical protein